MNRFLNFIEKIVHQTLLNLSLKCTLHMYRRHPGEIVLLHQPAITAGSLTPPSILLSSPTSFYVSVPTKHPGKIRSGRS